MREAHLHDSGDAIDSASRCRIRLSTCPPNTQAALSKWDRREPKDKVSPGLASTARWNLSHRAHGSQGIASWAQACRDFVIGTYWCSTNQARCRGVWLLLKTLELGLKGSVPPFSNLFAGRWWPFAMDGPRLP